MKTLWILVLVKRGFIQEPEIYYDGGMAEERRINLMSDFNLTYDEINIFSKNIFIPENRA